LQTILFLTRGAATCGLPRREATVRAPVERRERDNCAVLRKSRVRRTRPSDSLWTEPDRKPTTGRRHGADPSELSVQRDKVPIVGHLDAVNALAEGPAALLGNSAWENPLSLKPSPL
jgi:hypothetical protein